MELLGMAHLVAQHGRKSAQRAVRNRLKESDAVEATRRMEALFTHPEQNRVPHVLPFCR